MIKLSAGLVEEIKRHAEQEYPHECCGLLLGSFADDGRKRVAEVLPISNAREESARHNRSLILPEEYARAERLYAGRNLGVVGNYHSHPDHPAVPSEFDLEHLAPWPTMSYVVVSVREGKAVELRSWELEADRSRFKEEEVVRADDLERGAG